jgi:transcriptional regulator GlxA family with amidase domain
MSRRTSPPLLLVRSRLGDARPGRWAPQGIDPRIQAVLGAVRFNPAAPLRVSGVASRVGLSRSRFQHLFRAETGLPFTAALRRLRLARATSLLGDWTLRIKEVATLCGYSTTASFSKGFRRRFGRAPSHYRRSTSGQRIAHPDIKSILTA